MLFKKKRQLRRKIEEVSRRQELEAAVTEGIRRSSMQLEDIAIKTTKRLLDNRLGQDTRTIQQAHNFRVELTINDEYLGQAESCIPSGDKLEVKKLLELEGIGQRLEWLCSQVGRAKATVTIKALYPDTKLPSDVGWTRTGTVKSVSLPSCDSNSTEPSYVTIGIAPSKL